MNGFDISDAHCYMLSHINAKDYSVIRDAIPALITTFFQADLRFMRLTGVLDQNGDGGEADYDDDEAFEYILDATLAEFPYDEESAMSVAALLDCYMALQFSYLKNHGLA